MDLNTTTDTIFWGSESMRRISEAYKPYHGYLASVICVLGIIANGINVVVLTRKHMISSTNFILSAMATSDGLTMLAYLPFSLYFYKPNGAFGDPRKQTRISAHFLLFYVYFSVVVHSVSIWLTVTLAIFRYMFIKYPSKGPQLCSIPRAKIATIATCIATLFVCIPHYMTHNVIHLVGNFNGSDNTTTNFWTVGARNPDSDTWIIMGKVNFWIVSIFIKFLPCALLTIMSILLIKCMQEADKRRKNLRNANARGVPKAKEDEDSSRDRKTNRTTRMLVAVVVLFLICELPQGILGLLVGALGTNFQVQVYDNLGDLLDVIALFNNGINFVLYCSMSKQFRTTFVQLFFESCQRKRGRGRFTLVSDNGTNAISKSTNV